MNEKARIFGAHREEIWQSLKGHLREEGREWDGKPIRVRHGEFTIVLDMHAEGGGYATRVVTRIRAPFINKDGYRARIRRANWLMDLATRLGTQDIIIGDEAFDDEFVVQGRFPDKVKRFFADEKLRKMLIASPLDLFEIRDDEGTFGPEFPEGVDEAYAHSREQLSAVEDVEKLYGVFAELLNRLCHAGSAYEDDPNLEL